MANKASVHEGVTLYGSVLVDGPLHDELISARREGDLVKFTAYVPDLPRTVTLWALVHGGEYEAHVGRNVWTLQLEFLDNPEVQTVHTDPITVNYGCPSGFGHILDPRPRAEQMTEVPAL